MSKMLFAGVAGLILASTSVVAQESGEVIATPTAPIVAQAVPTVTADSSLPSNTEVFVSLDRKLDSHKVKVGDKLAFRVARDVMIGNHIVIPRGTPASGRISFRSGRGVYGKSAKLEFDIDTIDLQGHSIPVSGHYRIEGQGNTGATLGAVALTGLVGGLFVKGRSAVAAEGSEWKVMTKQPVPITIAS